MGDKFSTVNIRLYLSPEQSAQEENDLRGLLFGYSCPVNKDVEMYLREQAIEFTLKDQSVTYLVFSNINAELLGYFTIAVKPIIINAKNFSNHMKRKLSRSGEYDEITQTYSLAAYLVAQLGKNFAHDADKSISGKELLDLALDQVRELQYQAGGTVVFLESEDNESLRNFYQQEKGFKQFGYRETNSPEQERHKLVQMLKII